MTQDAQSVTQADRDAAASFYQDHLARPGEVPVAAAMRMRHIDESPLIQAFARHRLASQPSNRRKPMTNETALREAMEKIGSQAVCYGMTADEAELRDWLKNISDIAEAALQPEKTKP